MFIRSQTLTARTRIFAICNCNVNICNALRTSQLFNTPNMSRSAYVAKVETKDCVACGRCVEVLSGGCRKNGSETLYERWNHHLSETRACRIIPSGDRKNGIWITVITTASTVMIPERHRVRRHVRHNIAVQGYLKMAAQGRYTDALALIKRKIRSRQSAAVSATTAVRMHVQGELWIRQLQSMMSRNLSQNWI